MINIFLDRNYVLGLGNVWHLEEKENTNLAVEFSLDICPRSWAKSSSISLSGDAAKKLFSDQLSQQVLPLLHIVPIEHSSLI